MGFLAQGGSRLSGVVNQFQPSLGSFSRFAWTCAGLLKPFLQYPRRKSKATIDCGGPAVLKATTRHSGRCGSIATGRLRIEVSTSLQTLSLSSLNSPVVCPFPYRTRQRTTNISIGNALISLRHTTSFPSHCSSFALALGSDEQFALSPPTSFSSFCHSPPPVQSPTS